jgi:hypothetical protein
LTDFIFSISSAGVGNDPEDDDEAEACVAGAAALATALGFVVACPFADSFAPRIFAINSSGVGNASATGCVEAGAVVVTNFAYDDAAPRVRIPTRTSATVFMR